MSAPAAVKLATWTLQRVTRNDEGRLLEMYRSFAPLGAAAGLPPGDNTQAWIESLRGNPAFLMEVGGRAVGHAVLCPSGDSAEAALFVHQDWRGEGIGEELLQALVKEGKILGQRAIWGVAEAWNCSMIRLARRLGFVERTDGNFVLDLSSDVAPSSSGFAREAESCFQMSIEKGDRPCQKNDATRCKS